MQLSHRPASTIRTRSANGRRTAVSVNAFQTAAANSAQQGKRSSMKDEYVAQQGPWAQALWGLQQGLKEQVALQLEPVQLQPTKHSSDGVLSVWTLDGKSEFNVTSMRGTSAIKHMYQSCNMMPPMGFLHTKTGIHANMELGTPFLDVELGGNQKSALASLCFTPRLSTLRHKWYTDKYYRSVPPGDTELIPFTQIFTRSQSRVKAMAGPGMISNPTGKGSTSSEHPVYSNLISHQLWSRLMWGHAVMVYFDPSDPAAIEAVREDLTSVAALWCAWAKADAAEGRVLEPSLLAECKDFSRSMANFLDHDEDAAVAQRFIGPEGTALLKDTVAGSASLAGTPWWAT